MSQAGFALRGRNPDVLTCIANLSNDEVFTPPEFANEMLDLVERAWADGNDGANIWADKTVRFLDPFTKSGVFLREVVKRLVVGLESQMPDLQTRVDHILTNQVFGIAITELTSLLARRSLYCSKWANGEHSIASSMPTPAGNIWFERTEHTWTGGKCTFCGASLNRPGFCIRSFITLEGSGDASEEGVHARVQGAGGEVRARGDRAGRVTQARV